MLQERVCGQNAEAVPLGATPGPHSRGQERGPWREGWALEETSHYGCHRAQERVGDTLLPCPPSTWTSDFARPPPLGGLGSRVPSKQGGQREEKGPEDGQAAMGTFPVAHCRFYVCF